MGTKIKMVLGIIGAVILAYVILTVAMPVLVDFASTANTTIAASSNFSDYPGTQAALLGSPLWLYFAPAIVGIAAIVVVLKVRTNKG